MQSAVSKTWLRLVAGIVFLLALLIILNWPTAAVTSAVASSDRRPALLKEATWNDAASAERFYDRFRHNADDLE